MIKGRATNAPLLLILLLILMLAPPLANLSAAEEVPPEEGGYAGPCMGEEAFQSSWLDRTHAYITSILCQPSVWFDDFFGEHRAGEDWPGSLVRWRGGVRFDQQDGVTYRSEFSANFRLPKMNEKMKLVITSKTRDDQTSSHPDDDPYDSDPSAGITQSDNNQTTAGLRYYLIDTQKTRLGIGAGVKLGDPVQPYVRIRLRYTEPLGRSTLFRMTPTVIWFKEDGINRSIRMDLEHRLSEKVLIRGSQSFVRKELEPGVAWGTVMTLFDRLSAVTVLAFEAGVTGKTRPANHVERYRLATRLRSNFLKDWLFMEVEPEYYWPLDSAGERHLFRAITFRLELQFYS